jgi:glycerol transport system ATP-binding protein
MTVALDGVSKVVSGETHIDDLHLECEAGSFTVLLGLTRAGKTSVMRLMAGLDRPTSGRILVDGQDVTRVPVRRRNVAMVYQEFINYPSLSVYNNIASPLKLARVPRAEIDRRVRGEAERLRIDGLLERLPGELSGGQQQRTAMARALVRDANLLLLDEPLINLDYKLREDLRVELREIFQEREAVIVYATTEPIEALTLGGRTAVLHEGRLVQHGPTAQVYREPATVDVSQVFSDPPINLVGGRIGGEGITLGEDVRVATPPHLAALGTGDYRFGIRPAHLFLRPDGDADVAVPGEVEVAELSGSETYVHLRHGEASWVVQEAGVHPFGLGEGITVYLNPANLFAFDLEGRLVAAPGHGARAAA